MVEINLDQEIPSWLAILFSFMTTILISVHVFALMISTCILPNIETVEAMHNNTYVQQELLGNSRSISIDSSHTKFRKYIEVAWIFSTGFGALLFLIEIPILMLVKFYHLSIAAAYVSIGIMVPVCILFVYFALRFYRKLVEHKQSGNALQLEELQIMVSNLRGGEEEGTVAPSSDNSPKIGIK